MMINIPHRTVISDLQKTPDSMVVHAYILVDPDKENLYHSYTVWFSSEGFVKFGRWILFPANVNVERALVVPNRLKDKTFITVKCFSLDTGNICQTGATWLLWRFLTIISFSPQPSQPFSLAQQLSACLLGLYPAVTGSQVLKTTRENKFLHKRKFKANEKILVCQ